MTASSNLLALGAPGDALCADIERIASAHLKDVRAKLADLGKLERILADAVARCTGDRAPACAVLDILDEVVG